MTGISTPSNHQVHVIPRRLCSGWLRPGSASTEVCSPIPSHQTFTTFNEGPENAPFPSQGSQICSHCTFTTCASQNSSQTVIPVCPSSYILPTCSDIFLRITSGIWRQRDSYFVNIFLKIVSSLIISLYFTSILFFSLVSIVNRRGSRYNSSGMEDPVNSNGITGFRAL